MCDRDVIYRLRDVTGVGIARGPYNPSYPNAKPQWEWGVYRRPHVHTLLRAVLPMMGERRSARIREMLVISGTPYLKNGPLETWAA